MLAGPRARAWALRANLRTEDYRATTSFSILKENRIHFCIRFAAPGFDKEALAAQARTAFRIWIRALGGTRKAEPVAVNEVSCSSPTLNVMIDVSSYQTRYLGYTRNSLSGGRAFSYLNLSTGFVCANAPPNHALIDFETLSGSRKALDRDLSMFLAAPWTSEAYSDSRRLPLERVECSTLPVLIHEVGHTFGLCDTYGGRPQQECDPALQSPQQASSVMSGIYSFFLTPDDREGLRQAFRFVRSRADRGSPTP